MDDQHACAPDSREMLRLRDVFGLRACAGVGPQPLFRSRALTEASEGDIDALRRLGIGIVYDLRKEAERSMNPEPEIVRAAFDVRACTVDLQDDEERTSETKAADPRAAYGKPGERMLHLYDVMAGHSSVIAGIVRDIRAARCGVLVHCANGKDRVGVVCASVQAACGVLREAIVADYLVTNECNAAMNKRDLAHYAGLMPPSAVEVLAAMFEAREEYLAAFFDGIARRYGSVDEWLADGALCD